MLGWFKKKFKKQDKDAQQEIVEQVEIAPEPLVEPSEATSLEPDSTPAATVEEIPSPELDIIPAETAIEPPTATEPETEAPIVAEETLPEDTVAELPEPPETQADDTIPEEVDTIETLETQEVREELVEIPEQLQEPDLPEVEIEEVEVKEAVEETAAAEAIEEPAQKEPTVVETDVELPAATNETSDTIDDLPEVSERISAPTYQQPAEKPGSARRNFESSGKTAQEKSGLFSRLSKRLSKTRESFTYQMDALFLGKKEIDISLLDDLEEILILADLGVGTAQDLLEHARRRVKRKELKDPAALRQLLKDKISEYIVANDQDATLVMPEEGPFVIMVIGVNGVGKTTTIGKIAKKFINSGNSVMLVAADTFRAAAIAQLQIWGDRNNVPVIAHKEGSDPSSVVFDGIGAAIDKKVDVVLVDTAGRLHTKANLMEELKKIKRVMNKRLPGAPHETLLVIDATTGQNGVSQAKLFNEAVEVTGLALTKLDGTSKGGIVANICKDLKIPIRFIGIGEQVDDLRDFDASEFIDALFQARAESE